MTSNEQIRTIKDAFDRIKSAVGKEKEPLIRATEGSASGRALKLLLDPSAVFHIDKKSFKKDIRLLPVRSFPDIFALCDYLMTRSALTHQDIADVKAFISMLEEDLQQFVTEFLQKSLKIGVTFKTLNKCFRTEKIKTVSCMLANKYFEHADVVVGKNFAVTEKLDGIRCLAVMKKGEKPVLYSRQGKVIEGLRDIEDELDRIHTTWGYDAVFDGELLIRDRLKYPSKEQYKRTMKIVQSDSPRKPGIVFNVFDVLCIEEFDTQTCYTPYFQRRMKLEHMLAFGVSVKPVPVLYVGGDTSKIKALVDEQRAMDHEGVMINLIDAPYVFGRTSNLLKVKLMQDADLEIIDLKEGEGRFSGTLGSLVVDWKGNPVGVGSGLTDDFRRRIWANKEKYIGRIAKVRYFEETTDKNGIQSIRFPVFEEIREEGKEVSYA